MPIQTVLDSINNNIGSPFGFKNRVINGGMVIDQRNAGAEVNPAASGSYYLDRWQVASGASSKFKIGQNAGAVTPPAGFTNYLGCTSLSAYSVGASEVFQVRQVIEANNMADFAWGTANAQAVTLSFWVRSSLTGTFGGAIRNATTYNYSYPFTYSVNAANTWEYKTISIPGPTAGTWGTGTSAGLELGFSLGSGSTFSGTAGAWVGANYTSATGATSVVGTNGATFYITGVQLEKGSIATSFDYRDYGRELMMCQRYYAKMSGGGYSNFAGFASGFVTSATQVEAYIKYPVTMRATATFNYSNIRTNTASGTNAAITSVGNTYAGTDSLNVVLNSSGSTITAGQGTTVIGNNNSSAYIELSAEL